MIKKALFLSIFGCAVILGQTSLGKATTKHPNPFLRKYESPNPPPSYLYEPPRERPRPYQPPKPDPREYTPPESYEDKYVYPPEPQYQYSPYDTDIDRFETDPPLEK